MAISNLLKKLLAYLTLGIEPDPPEDQVDHHIDDNLEADLPDDPEEVEEQEESEELAESPPPTRAELRAANERAEAADRRAAEATEREAAALRARATPPQPSQHDTLYQQEEARLKDPATPELEKWQINGNRTMRQAQETAQNALFQSRDIADKTSFDRLLAAKPAVAKRYGDRVEKLLAEKRAQGYFPERRFVLSVLIGEDALKDEKPATGKNATKPPVNRGKPASGRSDVHARGNGGESKLSKLEKKLENVTI